jgi:hypothetical protein
MNMLQYETTVIVLTVFAHTVMMFEQSSTRQSLPVMCIT